MEKTYKIQTKKERFRFLYEMLRQRKPELAENDDAYDSSLEAMESLYS